MDDPGERLIAALYDGLAAEPGWQPFLGQLCAAIGAQAIDVVTEDFDTGAAVAYGLIGIDQHFRDTYDPRYVGDNPWLLHNLSPPNRTRGVRASPWHDPADLEDSHYYRHWLQPQGLRYMAACKLAHDGGRVTMFSALRNRRDGPFPDGSVHLIERLRPHLRQATVLTDRFGALALERDAALAALDMRSDAVLLAEADGRVVYRNAAAERLLPQAGPLYVGRGGRLACRSLLLHRQLANALRGAARPTAVAPPEMALWLPRADAPPLRLLVQPFVRREGPLPTTRHLALLTIADPQATPAAPEQLLRRHLGLSPAEARLAAALAAGQRLADFAEGAGIGRETARTLLKRAMRKTGARRQADLVRQVTLLAGGRSDS
jgi:DNA-binding CsgD family transcriptional regulator/PAS domain-containing protein